jgi:hypothetical protein
MHEEYPRKTLAVQRRARAFLSRELVLGGQVNDWEPTWDYASSGARRSVPARNAAFWNQDQACSYEKYAKRFEHADALLERLMQRVTITNKSQDTFDPAKTRYIRVTVLSNTADRGAQFVGVRAYEAT